MSIEEQPQSPLDKYIKQVDDLIEKRKQRKVPGTYPKLDSSFTPLYVETGIGKTPPMNKAEQILYLTRARNKDQKNPTDDFVPMDHTISGQVYFHAITWAQPYLYSKAEPPGTLILLNSGEFRTYTQSFDYVKQKVEQIVGQLLMEKRAVPTMPWWNCE